MNAKVGIIYAKQYQPFIKWVGGKRGLLKQLLDTFYYSLNIIASFISYNDNIFLNKEQK